MSYGIQKNNSKRYDWFFHLLLSISGMQWHFAWKNLYSCVWNDHMKLFMCFWFFITCFDSCDMFLLFFENIEFLFMESGKLPRPHQAMTSQAVYIIKTGLDFATKCFSKLKLIFSEIRLKNFIWYHTFVDRIHHGHKHFWSLLLFLEWA